MMDILKNLKFNDQGLIPCIVQEHFSGEVLMMAWMNEESIKLTLERGYCTYYSRSRQTLWKKGETSGNVQKLVSLSYDCDGDALLAVVEQTGPACHTGTRSCFNSPEKPFILSNILLDDYAVITDRRKNPLKDSYTNYLFDKGIDKICKKIGEESAEVIIASKNNVKKDTVGEISDLLYHLMVLMADRDITWEDVFGELAQRKGIKSEKVSKLRQNEEKPR